MHILIRRLLHLNEAEEADQEKNLWQNPFVVKNSIYIRLRDAV